MEFATDIKNHKNLRNSKKVSSLKQSNGILWILPAMIISVGLIYICIVYTGWISLFKWDGINPLKQFVGFSNYRALIKDSVFWKTIFHTAIFFVTTTIGQLGLGIIFAAFLHSKIKLKVIYKILIFVPSILAPATMAPVFRQIFAPDGYFNQLLKSVGLAKIETSWLASPGTALGVIIFIQIWQSVGVAFIIYYAAMGQIDPEMIEAARLDGAGNLRTLIDIVIPNVRGTTIALTTLSVIASLKTFDVPYLVTNGGPSFGTEFLGTYIYRISIPESNVGYGASLSVVLLVVAVFLAIVFNKKAGKKNV